MSLWGQQIGLKFFVYLLLIIKEIYNCMTSSIYPFTDSHFGGKAYQQQMYSTVIFSRSPEALVEVTAT